MKILHADTDDLDNPLRGGQPVRTWAINSRLSKDVEITVLTSVYKGCKRRLRRDNVNYERLGFRIPRFGLSPHLSFLASLGPKIARTEHDLVVEEFTPPVGFALTPWWTSKPVISCVQWYFFEQWEKRYKMPFSRWMERIALKKRYRYFITQTLKMRDEVLKKVPDAVVKHIPAGLHEHEFGDLPSILDRQSAQPSYALFLGRLDIDHKGMDLLVDAWEKLNVEVPLKIVGEGQAKNWLNEKIENSPRLAKTMTLLGRVEGEEKKALLSNAAFLVMPSRYETFGMVALEAMAVGTPVICYDIDNLNEVVSHECCELLDPFESDALSEAAERLWTNHEQRHGMEIAAYERACGFRWDILAQQQKEFYSEVLEQHKQCSPT